MKRQRSGGGVLVFEPKLQGSHGENWSILDTSAAARQKFSSEAHPLTGLSIGFVNSYAASGFPPIFPIWNGLRRFSSLQLHGMLQSFQR